MLEDIDVSIFLNVLKASIYDLDDICSMDFPVFMPLRKCGKRDLSANTFLLICAGSHFCEESHHSTATRFVALFTLTVQVYCVAYWLLF